MRYRITDWFVLTAILAVYAFAFAVTPIDYSRRATLLVALMIAAPVTQCFLARRRAGEAFASWRSPKWFWLTNAAVLAVLTAVSFGVITGGVDGVPIGQALLVPLFHLLYLALGAIAVGRGGLLVQGRCLRWEHYRPTLIEEDGELLLGLRWAQETRAQADRVSESKKPRPIRVPAEHADAVRQAVAEIEAALAQVPPQSEREA